MDSLGLRILHSLDALCSEEEILLIKERVNRNLKVNLNEPSSVIANGQLGEGGTADIFECINGVIGEKHPFMRHYLAVNQAVAEGTGVDLTGHLQDVLGTEDFLIMQGNSRKVEAKIIDSDSGLKAVYRMESIIKIADGITLDLKDQIPFVSYMTLDLSDQNAVPEVVFDLEYSDGKKEYKSTNMMNEEVTINGFSKDSDDRIKITGYVESMNGAYEERLNEVKAEFDSVEPGVEYKPAVEGDLSFAPAGAARNDSGLGETSTDNDPNLPPAGNNERPSPVVSSPRNEGVALNGVSSNGAIAVK